MSRAEHAVLSKIKGEFSIFAILLGLTHDLHAHCSNGIRRDQAIEAIISAARASLQQLTIEWLFPSSVPDRCARLTQIVTCINRSRGQSFYFQDAAQLAKAWASTVLRSHLATEIRS